MFESVVGRVGAFKKKVESECVTSRLVTVTHRGTHTAYRVSPASFPDRL